MSSTVHTPLALFQAHPSPTGHHLPSNVTGDQAMPTHESQHSSSRSYPSCTLIHILDDDSLLEIFYLCRPVSLDEREGYDPHIRVLRQELAHDHWWYKPAQVCRRWRLLILASARNLRLSLACTRGTPVAEMLAHSPPLPLIIGHTDDFDITTEDEEGIMLALKHRDRVRRIHLDLPVQSLHKLIMELEDEFPILEYLCIGPVIKQNTSLKLPKSFRAPHLRHLELWNFAFPIGSPLLTTFIGLVTLSLDWIVPPAYFHPNELLQRLSQMPQIETINITFHSPVPNRDVKWELLRRSRMTQVTLLNLSWFRFGGASAYLEAILPCITAPRLANLRVIFFNQLTFRLPHLMEFLNRVENLRFRHAEILFEEDEVSMQGHLDTEAGRFALYVGVGCRTFDWQVASTAEIFCVLKVAFPAVEVLTLNHLRSDVSSESHGVVRTQWHDLLRSFSSVKTLQVDRHLVEQLSHSLQVDDGESPMELLPELKLLSYPIRFYTLAFTQFIDARQVAGRPITLGEYSLIPFMDVELQPSSQSQSQSPVASPSYSYPYPNP